MSLYIANCADDYNNNTCSSLSLSVCLSLSLSVCLSLSACSGVQEEVTKEEVRENKTFIDEIMKTKVREPNQLLFPSSASDC